MGDYKVSTYKTKLHLSLTDVSQKADGQPAFVMDVNGRSSGIMIFDVRNGRIQNIYSVVNSDKLKII